MESVKLKLDATKAPKLNPTAVVLETMDQNRLEKVKHIFKRALALAAIMTNWGSAALAGDLNIGSSAPKLRVKSFVKGSPVCNLRERAQ